jgi:hypothetical protein
MKHKLIMIWHLLKSHDWIVITDKQTNVNASTEIIGRTVGQVKILIIQTYKMQKEIQTMADQLKDWSTLPTNQKQGQVFDVLTEAEKAYHIEYATEQAKQHFFKQRQMKGEHVQDIAAKWAQVNIGEVIDFEKVIKDANQRKIWIMEEEEFKRQKALLAAKQVQSFLQRCNCNYFYNLIKSFFLENYGQFIWEENENQHYIKAVCFFLSNDPRFEIELGYSFRKGLWISGRFLYRRGAK